VKTWVFIFSEHTAASDQNDQTYCTSKKKHDFDNDGGDAVQGTCEFQSSLPLE